jgi:hypothetical protein
MSICNASAAKSPLIACSPGSSPRIPAPWVLKGGYLMELRLQMARSTRDVDLTLRGKASLVIENRKERNQAVRELLEDDASRDLDDFFVYVIGEAMMDLNVPAYGGARFPVEARIDGRRFVNFHIDIAVGDVLVEPLDRLPGRGWLDFAGIAPTLIQAISSEQQFAEKLLPTRCPVRMPIRACGTCWTCCFSSKPVSFQGPERRRQS